MDISLFFSGARSKKLSRHTRPSDAILTHALVLGFPKHELSAYASVFHIMAMRAAAELAIVANDTTSAAKFSAAAARASVSLDTLQWVNGSTWTSQPDTYCPKDYDYQGSGFTVEQCLAKTFGPSMFLSTDGRGDCYTCRTTVTANESGYTLYTKSGTVEGSWAAASDGCTDKQGCTTQEGLFADALYAQVLAYSAGLGTLVSSEAKLRQHLHAQLATNCAHAEGAALAPGCANAGMVTLTGRAKLGPTDWQIWEGIPPNHASLSIHTGQDPATALENFHSSATSWSERTNDQWNTAGIKDSDGYPTVTSHYGFHMVSWHVPLAISGQLADLSNSNNRTLTFAPAVSAPYTLPILLPGILGTVASPSVGKFIVQLSVGDLKLHVLAVDGHRAPDDIHLQVGAPVTWNA